MSPAAAAAARAHTEIAHQVPFGVWCNARKREATYLSQGHRGRYGRRTGQEIREDTDAYAVLDALAVHFRSEGMK